MTIQVFPSNTLFYGDNLDVIRKRFPNECIDLIYLDPPFNSKADYNILFKETTGEQSAAQIQAFSDFWHWNIAARHAYEYLISNEVNEKVASLSEALYRFLGTNDMSAYLFMMTERLLELHRVLKPTGSLFLHCDPKASHYLKIVLDAIFDPTNFRNEIIWKRTFAHNDASRCGAIHDTILFYAKTPDYYWHTILLPLSEDYKEEFLDQKDPKTGKRYARIDLTGAGITKDGESGKPWRGIDPTSKGRHWAYDRNELERLDKEGRIHWPRKGVPRYKKFEDEFEGMPLQDIWNDIRPLHNLSRERLGFQTQKPLPLLERIIDSASKEGQWVLDPFCGCGTTIIAAEKLRRHWVGIDITYLAINLVKNRLETSFPNCKFDVEGEPRDMGAAIELAQNRYQFQWWALSLVGARPVGSKQASPHEGKKGADEGIDGWLRFSNGAIGRAERVVVQVKSGHVGVKDIRELRDTVSRQNAAIGLFITLEEPTREMLKEISATSPYVSPRWKHEYPKIQILTIAELFAGKKPDMPPTISPLQEAPQLEKRKRGVQTRFSHETA
jgi:site-specific DNA-methyltransferase (adenine-specific)